jgi:hypothetical protein
VRGCVTAVYQTCVLQVPLQLESLTVNTNHFNAHIVIWLNHTVSIESMAGDVVNGDHI